MLDERARDILSFVQRQAQRNPDVVFGDGKERTRDSPEGRKFGRRLAAEGIVVLKNEQDVLPIEAKKVKRVALIGPNMKDRIISGGGSAALKASYIVTPYAGIVDNAPKGIEFDYAVGCYGAFRSTHRANGVIADGHDLAYKYTPTLEAYLKTPSGQPGWSCTFFNHDANGNSTGDPVAEFFLQDTRVKLNDFLPKGLTETWTIKLHGRLTMDKTADYEMGLTVAGRAKLFVNDKLIIDNWTKQRPGDFFYGYASCRPFRILSADGLVRHMQTRYGRRARYHLPDGGEAGRRPRRVHERESSRGHRVGPFAARPDARSSTSSLAVLRLNPQR